MGSPNFPRGWLVLEPIKVNTIEDFAKFRGLTLRCKQHPLRDWNPTYQEKGERWTCSFDGIEVKQGSSLLSAYGDADNPDAAIQDYIRLIEGKQLVYNASDPRTRREFTAWQSMVHRP